MYGFWFNKLGSFIFLFFVNIALKTSPIMKGVVYIMMTKIIKVKKSSCKGKEFECTMRIQCNTPEENEAKYERYLAELERERMMDLYKAERALHPCTMKELDYIIDEFIENVRDLEW